MKTYKFVILGAGPSGLAFAHTLKNHGEDSFLILEKESVAGGLCRSERVDGGPLDIGGGHFLDIKRKEVLELLFQFLPRSEWCAYRRISKINIRGMAIDYPLEANLWQLPILDRVDFLESIAKAGCMSGTPMPESFKDWISWKLGDRIAQEYMLPYNRKIWSTDLNALGTYWLYKLPNVSFRETLLSCIEGKPAGTLPAHGAFLYPRHYGYGEVWKRMGEALKEHLLTSTTVTSINTTNRIINGSIKAEKIITSIPWTLWLGISEMPKTIENAISCLQYSQIDVDYYPEILETEAHWIYEPDEHLSYHRILCRNNFSEESRGFWTESNSQRSGATKGLRYRNEYAYPLNTLGKPDAIGDIIAWAKQKDIIGLGRWGTWEHMNSDVAVSMAIEAALESLNC